MKTEYLTHQEYFKKRANIIEDIKGVSIDLTYQRGTNNYVTPAEKANTYIVNICTPNEKGINRKAALYHELSHLMWDSFAPNVSGLTTAWANELVASNKELSNEASADRLESIKKSIKGEYMLAFNIIEDQRIESLTKHVWLGTQKMFDETRTNLGKRLLDDTKGMKTTNPEYTLTPTDKMLASRFFQPSLSEDWANEIMEDVKETGTRGALTCLVRAKKHIDEYIKDKLHDYKNKNEKLRELQKGINTTQETLRNSEATEAEVTNAENEKESLKREQQEIFNEKAKVGRSMRNSNNTKYSHDHDGLTQSGNHMSAEEQEEITESAKEMESQSEQEHKTDVGFNKKDGQEEIENMKASIEAMSKMGSMTPSNIKKVGRPDSKVTVDSKTARVLQKTFTKLAEQFTSNIDDYGNEVNIEAFINRKVRQSNDPCMINEKLSTGATVLISIDGSGSMGNSGRMTDARNLVATLYKASEKVQNIDLVGNVWSSDYEGNVGMTTFKSLSDCSKISTHDTMMFTPTHEALIYSAKQLRGRKGRKKLLIMITDGVPQYYKNHIDTPTGVLIKMNKKALKKALRISPRIICIDISNHWKYGEVLKDIFGKRYVSFTGMNGASKFVIKEFRKIVQEVMR